MCLVCSSVLPEIIVINMSCYCKTEQTKNTQSCEAACLLIFPFLLVEEEINVNYIYMKYLISVYVQYVSYVYENISSRPL